MKHNHLNDKDIRKEKIKYYEKLANDIRLNFQKIDKLKMGFSR